MPLMVNRILYVYSLPSYEHFIFRFPTKKSYIDRRYPFFDIGNNLLRPIIADPKMNE